MQYIEVILLGLIQGITEFLPISSSGHLILPEFLFGFKNEGLSFMVAVHVGSLLAVIVYFLQDLIQISRAWVFQLLGQKHDEKQAKLAWWVIIATIPAGLIGLLFKDVIELYLEQGSYALLIISATMGGFGLLLWWADAQANKIAATNNQQDLQQLSFKQTLIIGLAQALALIPGTSRSGITMTAALALGLSRQAASRFSFLLSIPLIVAAGLLLGKELATSQQAINFNTIAIGTLVSAISAYACIHWFLKYIERIGFKPFVYYRLLLSVFLLIIWWWQR